MSLTGDPSGLGVIDGKATDPWSLCVEASRFADMGEAAANDVAMDLFRKAALSLDHLREASIYAGLSLNDRADALLREGLAKLDKAGTYFARSYLEIDPNFNDIRRSLVLPRPGVRAQPR